MTTDETMTAPPEARHRPELQPAEPVQALPDRGPEFDVVGDLTADYSMLLLLLALLSLANLIG